MKKLTRDDLYSLEKYAEIRPEFRKSIMAHKKNRVVHVGPNLTLHFEDQKTMSYQVQEMLRAEKIFEAEGIEEELAAYNPLIPDGSNWKATMMVEFSDADERRDRLSRLIGLEEKVYVQVAGFDPVTPIANEDLDRTTSEKTSSVHFLRFELTPAMIDALKNGAAISVGVDHPEYRHRVDAVPDAVRQSLAGDLEAA
ncbi:MAG: DUF3501 family protein [Thioalkalivibrionaceae bacterium]